MWGDVSVIGFRKISILFIMAFAVVACSQEQDTTLPATNTSTTNITTITAAVDSPQICTDTESALCGRVSSLEEGPMEGVLVTARREGANFTVTVVSDTQGQYKFPASRLEPGSYSVSIRAVGFELPDPGQIKIAAKNMTLLALSLRTAGDIASQLSNGEWLLSMSGTVKEKQQFLGCVGCHTLERVVRSRYNANDFAHVVNRMRGWAQGSTPLRPQMRPDFVSAKGGMNNAMEEPGQRAVQIGEFASTINLSKVSRWDYSLKTLPRPTGKGTRVIMTEYDLPRPESLPHDAIVDKNGMVWYGDFGSQYLGKLDPETGETIEYPVPLTKPEVPGGNLDMNFDPDGNIFLGMMYQGVIMRFNVESETFDSWKSPLFDKGDAARTAMVTPTRVNVDGKVWTGGVEEYQVDLETGEWIAIDYTKGVSPERLEEASKIGSYGVAVDSMNNFYGMELGGDHVTRVDAKTLVSTPHRTPTPDSGPRRGHMDQEDRLWFGEFRGNRIAMFDTKAEEFKEWELPVAWTNPYDAVLDKDGYAWGGGMTNDYVGRVNTKTDEVTMYLLPGTTNIRRVDVDNSTSPPSFWVGDNLEGTLIRVEPLE
jgi:virginiamycin B lyase